VVVGGGLSGLAAAHFYRARLGTDRRILLLDSHDDFGGHAKRNEFHLGGSLQLLNGGTLEIDSPRPYSAVSQRLLQELGVDVAGLARKVEHRRFYEGIGLHPAAFFDRETFGADHLAVALRYEAAARGAAPLAQLLAQAPLSPQARLDMACVAEDMRPNTTRCSIRTWRPKSAPT